MGEYLKYSRFFNKAFEKSKFPISEMMMIIDGFLFVTFTIRIHTD